MKVDFGDACILVKSWSKPVFLLIYQIRFFISTKFYYSFITIFEIFKSFTSLNSFYMQPSVFVS